MLKCVVRWVGSLLCNGLLLLGQIKVQQILRAMNMKFPILISWMICISIGIAAGSVRAQQDGANLFGTHCAICHEAAGGEGALGPELDVMRQMTSEHILEVMETGVMQSQARERSRAQRHTLAEYLSGKAFGTVPDDPVPQTAFCGSDTVAFSNTLAGPEWNGWGKSITNARFQPQDSAGLSAKDVPRLRLKWAFGYPGPLLVAHNPLLLAAVCT